MAYIITQHEKEFVTRGQCRPQRKEQEADMKTLGLVVIAFSIAAPSAAQAAVFTVNGPLSYLCYKSALTGDPRAIAIDGCSRALSEEAMAPHERAATYVNRGILYMSDGRYAKADTDFDAALRLDQGLSDGWLNKGFLRLRKGAGREALPLIQKGIDTGAGNQALAMFARGVAHEQMGELRSAYADLQRAHQLQPKWSLPTEYLASYQVIHR
jgi:tetratricopeptide (TPR) repeat protein